MEGCADRPLKSTFFSFFGNFRAIFSHGFVVDANKMKMSKSIGNVVHPKDIIGEEGIDVLRYWVASHVIGQSSIPVAPHLIKQSAERIKATRMYFKFLLGYIEELPDDGTAAIPNDIDYNKLTALDKWCLNALTQFHDAASMNRSNGSLSISKNYFSFFP